MVYGPNEINLLKEYNHYIFSWDSSSAIWAGINDINYDNSQTGLIHGKFEKEVDFDYNQSLTYQQEASIMHNINYINRLVN